MYLAAQMRNAFLLSLLLLVGAMTGQGQSLLNKTVSIKASRRPLAAVLDDIGRQGQFHFSYVPEFIGDDSLVSIQATQKTVKQVLDQLFQGNCQYKEMGDQLILQRIAKEKWFVVSGRVTDAMTGAPVSSASVYERMQLISTMTNDQGFYHLRLKEKAQSITISKELYKDTIVYINSGYDQNISASIKPATAITLTVVDVNQHTRVEQTWLGRFMISSRQRVQSLNIANFLTNQPYQSSLVPGAGTHGRMSAQVVNKISLNIIGGYTAGLNGVEMASIFNIDRKDVQYVQAAGIFNIVGGTIRGVELAGIYNQGMDSLSGVQASSAVNTLKHGFTGVQISGLYNRTGRVANGVQAAGLVNEAHGLEGAQLAGIGNIATDTVRGVQIAGVFNKGGYVDGVQASYILNEAHVLKGLQIGVVNIADSSDGYSIGILNIVKHGGIHQLLVYNNELLHANVAFKSGNRKLYTILTAGMRLDGNSKLYGIGAGLGHAFTLRHDMDLNVEAISEQLYMHSKGESQLSRLQISYQYRRSKNLAFFAGPAFNVFTRSDDFVPVAGYKYPNTSFNFSRLTGGWIGWQLGVSIFP
jgi:hypothetical protein